MPGAGLVVGGGDDETLVRGRRRMVGRRAAASLREDEGEPGSHRPDGRTTRVPGVAANGTHCA